VIADLLPAAELVPEEVQGKACGLPITEQQLCFLLASQRVQVARVITRTLPKFHRGSPFKPRSVVSLCVRCGFIGADYLRVVLAQRKREGIDLSGIPTRCRPGRLWRGKGEHVTGNRHLVRHRDRGLLYLVLYPKTDAQGTPVESYRRFFNAHNLLPIDGELVNRWRVRSPGSDFAGTKKRIPWRLPCLGSITSITLGGTPYTIVGERSKPMHAETKSDRRQRLEADTDQRLQKVLFDAADKLEQPIRAGLAHVQPVRVEYEADTVPAMGQGGPGHLTRKMNEIARRGGEVFQVLQHGSSFLICSRYVNRR